ncbi:MAG: hypothetical protein GY832_44520 [Chloroflexi bacterium]|nr:hypothetical protein [Chloroflexota bacterium]
MTTFTVTMVRSSGITDAECKQRLKRAFDILLDLGKRAAALDTVGSQSQDSGTPLDRGAKQSIPRTRAS